MMRFSRSRNGGFTSLELMAATSITAIFAISFYTAFHVMGGEMWKNRMYADTNRSAKNVMDRLAKDVCEAVCVQASYGGNSTGNSCLILKLPSIDSTGVPTSISTQFDYVTYKINPSDSTQLLRSLDVLNGTSQREGGADTTNVVIARKVSSISFTSGGTGLSSISSGTIPTLKYINAQITTQGTTVNTSQQTQVDTDLMLKNYIT